MSAIMVVGFVLSLIGVYKMKYGGQTFKGLAIVIIGMALISLKIADVDTGKTEPSKIEREVKQEFKEEIQDKQRILCYSSDGRAYYIDTNEIYDSRPNYFVDVLTINSETGTLIERTRWHFSSDEGIIFFENEEDNGKVLNSVVATAIYNTMTENLSLAKRGTPR